MGKKYNEFKLYLETGTGFRFLTENENADTFLLPVEETIGGVSLYWDSIEQDIKNMGLHLFPMAELEVLEGVTLLLPERKFVWNQNGGVFIVHPVYYGGKSAPTLDGDK